MAVKNYKIVAFPEDLDEMYHVVDEDAENYLVVNFDIYPRWLKADKFDRAQYYQEWVPKNIMKEITKINGTMKLKKGSKEAKEFMAKIRRMKGKPKRKKSKIGVVKRSTRKLVKKNTSFLGSTQHNDTKSHNYKISISGTERKKLSKDAISSMRSIAKAIQIIYKRNAWGDSELKNRENIAQAYTMLWELILSNGYTITQSGKLTKAIH